MWKRTEFRYETMMSMAMFVEAGIWKIRDEDDRPATKEEVLNGFQEALLADNRQRSKRRIWLQSQR